MSARRPRWEIVRTDAGFTIRFRASNGKVIVSSGGQVYSRRRGAIGALDSLLDAVDPKAERPLEVRDIDARTGATP